MSARPLTVLHLDTERGWRGGERQALWLAERLARGGDRSLVAARPGEPLAERAAAAGLPVVPCAPAGEFDIAAALRLRGVVRRERVDIVHAHTGHAVALAALATLGTRARVVVTRRVDFRLRANPFTRWKYGRAAAIIAISRMVQRALEESGIAPSRIELVPSGVDLSRVIAPAGFVLAGYQFDMDLAGRFTGMLYEEQGRGILMRPGQTIRIGSMPDGQKKAPVEVNANGLGSSRSTPERRTTSARKKSSPRSSIVYFSRACLRFARSPQSRCTVTTASAIFTASSVLQEPMTSAVRG